VTNAIKRTRKTVLFVDDDERVLRALEATFEDDYNVITDISANNALKTLRDVHIDIIVSDQRMPEMLGYQFLAQARKVRPDAIRILMTGYSDKKSIIETINKGEVFRFVAKPWTLDEFTEILSQASIASEASNIELPQTAQKPTSLNSHWKSATKTLGHSPSVLMFTRENYRKALLKLASKGFDAKVYISKSLSVSLDAIVNNNDIGIVFIEMNSLNAEIISALALLKRSKPEVVVIILAQASDFNVAVKLINNGQAFRYLCGPIDLKILQTSIRSALIRHVKLSKNKQYARRYTTDTRDLSISQRVARLIARLTGNKKAQPS